MHASERQSIFGSLLEARFETLANADRCAAAVSKLYSLGRSTRSRCWQVPIVPPQRQRNDRSPEYVVALRAFVEFARRLVHAA
jgi:hypothetical protein